MKKLLLTTILCLSVANSKPVSLSGFFSRHTAIVAIAGGAMGYSAIQAVGKCSSVVAGMCKSTWRWVQRNKFTICGVALCAVSAVIFQDKLFNVIDSVKDDINNEIQEEKKQRTPLNNVDKKSSDNESEVNNESLDDSLFTNK